MFIFGLLWLAVIVLNIVAGWRVFEKACRTVWASIIPFYSTYVMLKIVGKPSWWMWMIFLVPIANIVYAIWMINMLSKSFGKDEGFTVGLLLVGVVFWPILGLGDARYIGPYGDPVAFKAAQNPQFDFDKPATA
jgi:Na+/melibiose symporter-like transporter